jgi:hypothetical protein
MSNANAQITFCDGKYIDNHNDKMAYLFFETSANIFRPVNKALLEIGDHNSYEGAIYEVGRMHFDFQGPCMVLLDTTRIVTQWLLKHPKLLDKLLHV